MIRLLGRLDALVWGWDGLELCDSGREERVDSGRCVDNISYK